MHLSYRTSVFPFAFSAVALAGLACSPKTLPSVSAPPVSAVQLASDQWRDIDHIFVLTDASGSMYMEETFPQAKARSWASSRSLPIFSICRPSV